MSEFPVSVSGHLKLNTSKVSAKCPFQFDYRFLTLETAERIFDKTIRNATIYRKSLHHCIIKKGIIWDSELYDCFVYRGTSLINCRTYNCEIRRSVMNRCQAYGGAIERCKRGNTDFVRNCSSLELLPTEILLMIFGYTDMKWDGKAPATLIAMRSNKALHADALEAFVKSNFYKFRIKSDILKETEAARREFRNLLIQCSIHPRGVDNAKISPACFAFLGSHNKLTRVTIKLADVMLHATTETWVKALLESCEHLKVLEVVFPLELLSFPDIDRSPLFTNPEAIRTAATLDEFLGIKGVLSQELKQAERRGWWDEQTTCMWEAPRNWFLEWNEPKTLETVDREKIPG